MSTMSGEPRVTVVTGASQGIGRVIAREFGACGDVVVLAARNEAGLSGTAEMVAESGGSPMVVETDVTSESSVAALVEAVTGEHGRIDVLVNNSGIGGPSGRLWEVDPGEWMSTFEVNVFGVFLMTRAVLPVMVGRRRGSVVIIGSISGKRPLLGRSAYTTTKTALIGLTLTLAVEAGAEVIRVNLISPGFVSGPRIEWAMQAQAEARGVDVDSVRREFEGEAALGRLTEPEDVARAAVFLASDQASGITGADLNVNSGVVMY
jgi:NAD(P)-dependent dehydrogenase (short-subunit alcohol dehydrogenase family)